MKRRHLIPWLMVIPTILVLLFLGIYPLIYSLWLSVHSYSLLEPFRGIVYVGLRNYVNILTRPGLIGISLFGSACITAIYTVTSVILEITIGLCIALISLHLLGSRRWLSGGRTAFMMPMLLAPVVVGSIFRYMYQVPFGVFNLILEVLRLPTPRWLSEPSWALVSLIMTNVWMWVPFSFLILLAAIVSIPGEQLEAAMVDGANKIKLFFYIILPSIKSAIFIILLIRSIDLVRTFDLVYILTRGGPGSTTAVLAYNAYLLGFRYFEIGEAAAYSYYMLIIINIIVLLFMSVLRKEIKLEI